MKSFVVSCLFLLVISLCPLVAGAADYKISEMAVTTKIVKGNPIDSVHRISSASVKQLFCFTRINGSDGLETTLKHVWYHNGEKAAEYELPVKGKRWRTYSKKAVEKGVSAGDWRVEAQDSEGNVLKAVTFRMN